MQRTHTDACMRRHPPVLLSSASIGSKLPMPPLGDCQPATSQRQCLSCMRGGVVRGVRERRRRDLRRCVLPILSGQHQLSARAITAVQRLSTLARSRWGSRTHVQLGEDQASTRSHPACSHTAMLLPAPTCSRMRA